MRTAKSYCSSEPQRLQREEGGGVRRRRREAGGERRLHFRDRSAPPALPRRAAPGRRESAPPPRSPDARALATEALQVRVEARRRGTRRVRDQQQLGPELERALGIERPQLLADRRQGVDGDLGRAAAPRRSRSAPATTPRRPASAGSPPKPRSPADAPRPPRTASPRSRTGPARPGSPRAPARRAIPRAPGAAARRPRRGAPRRAALMAADLRISILRRSPVASVRSRCAVSRSGEAPSCASASAAAACRAWRSPGARSSYNAARTIGWTNPNRAARAKMSARTRSSAAAAAASSLRPDHARGELEIAVVAEHGDRPRQLARGRSERGEPVQDEAAHGGGPDRLHLARGRGRRLDPRRVEGSEQLTQEQRIAARRRVTCAAELLRRLRAQALPRQSGRRGLAQRSRVQRDR